VTVKGPSPKAPPKNPDISGRSSCTPLTPSNPSTFWYEDVLHNGQSSFLDSAYKSDYTVFRNVVTDFGADNTGATDASAAIQNAINGMSPLSPANITSY
jgi:glucan 1,3-beta-glucosidase